MTSAGPLMALVHKTGLNRSLLFDSSIPFTAEAAIGLFSPPLGFFPRSSPLFASFLFPIHAFALFRKPEVVAPIKILCYI